MSRARARAGKGSPIRVLLGIALPLACGSCISAPAPVATTPAPASTAPASVPAQPQQDWVDSVLANMSLRDRAAQLVWPQVFADFAPASTPGWQRIEDFIVRDHVGGIIMSIGSPIEMAAKINAMQRLSALPLVLGADFEAGAGFRARGGYFLPNAIYLGGATIFPPEMAIGATRDTALAYEMGRVTAVEGRALGVHIAFTPVLDVNNNPANPVIGPRSFGENPQLVAALGRAMVHGLQENGMLATAKHFPGHGDTDQNSHLTLPTIHASRARLDTVELVPFKAAIDAGVAGVMTFHGRVPALDSNPVPATLSRPIMTHLLREELGFRGLLITDAMDMNGVLASVSADTPSQTVTNAYGTINSIGLAEACKRAIAAGADVLLMPSDVPTAIDAVVQGVAEGRFSQAQVDESVRRVLMEKRRLGLDRNRFVDVDSVRRIVGDTSHTSAAQVAAERSITLAKDSLGLVPAPAARATAAGPVLSITIAGHTDLGAGNTFNAELRRAYSAVRTATVDPQDPGTNYDRLLSAADSAGLVVVSSYLAPGTRVVNVGAPDDMTAFLQAVVRRNPRTIVVAFGNPYLLQQIPSASTYLVAWGGFPVSQRAAALALTGRNAITGKLPISIPPLLPYGAGIQRVGQPE